MKNIIVGIDIGGTNSPFGFVNDDGEILGRGSIRTDEFENVNDYLDKLTREILNKAGNSYKISCIGIGAANGNYFTGTIENAINLPWKEKICITDEIKKRINVPVFLTNDANAAAAGEKMFGNAKNMNDFIVITLGTGLGSGVYCGGKMLYGYTGFAGEMGHITVVPGGRLCGCGRHGCLETYASATGIKKTAIELLAKGKSSFLNDYPEIEITAKLINEAALKGDVLALEAFRYTGEILGKAMANVASLFSPEAFFLFGGLSNAGEFIFQPTKKYMEENMLPAFKDTVKILPSGLKENSAAILGAAALCREEIEF